MICPECLEDIIYNDEGCDACREATLNSDLRIGVHDASFVPDDIEAPMLLWTDPPYGTGKTMRSGASKYKDHIDTGYVIESICEWLPILHPNATVAVCCDYRLAPKMVTAIVAAGWEYRGEIIWEFGLGRPRKDWWPVRHNNILTFGRDGSLFDPSAAPRVKRLAKKKGYGDDKPAGSVWFHTMSNTDPERVDYPNQKPLAIVEPFVLAHTLPGDLVVDPFAGSGTTAVAALKHGRKAYVSDSSWDSYNTIVERVYA